MATYMKYTSPSSVEGGFHVNDNPFLVAMLACVILESAVVQVMVLVSAGALENVPTGVPCGFLACRRMPW